MKIDVIYETWKYDNIIVCSLILLSNKVLLFSLTNFQTFYDITIITFHCLDHSVINRVRTFEAIIVNFCLEYEHFYVFTPLKKYKQI